MNAPQSNPVKGDILIVDDDLPSLRALSTLLTDRGYKVRGAKDGPTALMMAGAEPPDLILLDVMMPEMDGYQVCQRLKSNAETHDIPVIFVSALDEVFDKVKGFELGGVDHIVKPFEAEEVLARVNTHLTLHKLQADLIEANQHLEEQIKGLNCLYGVSRLVEQSGTSLPEILQGVVHLIPPAWQYPEVTGARVLLNDHESRTENFQQTDWRLAREIVVYGERAGLLEVCYLEERPIRDEGPFLNGEIDLLNAIAERLGRIAERLQAEEALRESEERHRSLFEGAEDHIFVLDQDFRYVTANPSALKAGGLTLEDVAGKGPRELFPEDAEFYLSQYRRAFETGEPVRFERELRLPHGVHWFSVTLSPIRDARGRVTGLTGISRDITERKRAEDQLRFQAHLLDAVEQSVIVTDLGGRVVYWNPFAEWLYGWSSEEAMGRTTIELIASEQAQQYGVEIMARLQAGESWSGEYLARRRDGTLLPIQVTLTPISDARGELTHIVGISADITERRQAEDALRESEQRFRALYQGIPVPVYAWQRCEEDFVLVDHNDAAAVTTDGKITDYLGRTATVMYPDRPDILEDLSRCFVEKTSIQREMAYQFMTTGESKHLVVKYAFVPPDLVLVHTEDITERKQAEAALAETNQLLEMILQYTHVMVAYLDPQFNFMRVNRAYAEADERDPSFFPGKNHFDLYPNAQNEAIFQRVVETGEPYFTFAKPFEYAEHPERGVTHWDWSLVPIKDSASTVTGLILTLADVTERVQVQEALKRSEERYALAQRAANIGSWDWNIPTGDLYWSGEIEPMFGFRRGEFGATFEAFLQCVHPEDRQFVMDSVNACVQQGADYAIEHRIVWPDGTTRWVAETGDVFRDQDGQAIRMLGVVRDITARKQAEEALLRRVGELSTLHSIAQTVATIVDLPQTLGVVAEAMTYLFDARATFITVPDAEHMELQILAGFERTSGAFATMPRAFPLAEMPISRQVLDQGQTVVLPDVQILSLPAAVRAYVRALDLHALMLVPLRARGATIGLLAMGSDRTDRAFDPAEVALVETIASDVAGAVESTRLAEQARAAAVDAERQRLARELHDSATQSLYSITLFANGWRTMAEQGRLDNVADCFERIGDVGQQALKEMRLLIHQLRPPILEEVGLVGAIQQRLDTVEHRVNVETRLLTQGEVDQLPQAAEEQLFHIAQEALNNALRHAHATTVTVQVCAEDDRFVLSVEDDGVGFDPSADTVGMGLVNMRERAAAIGGKVRITSAPQQGTTVEVTLGELHGR